MKGKSSLLFSLLTICFLSQEPNGAVNSFCEPLKIKLAVEKTMILTPGSQDSGPDLEAVIIAKYLGISLQMKGSNMIKERELQMISSARKFAQPS